MTKILRDSGVRLASCMCSATREARASNCAAAGAGIPLPSCALAGMADKSAAKSATITPIAKAAGRRPATKIGRMDLFPGKFRMIEREVDVSLTDLRYTRPTRGTPTIRTRERSETLLALGESGKSSRFGLEGR